MLLVSRMEVHCGKYPMKDSEWRVMARPVKNNIIHQDYDLNLYSSPLYNKLFVVMDKVLADQTHHFFIYSIDTPLMQEDEIRQQVKQKEWSAMPLFDWRRVSPSLFLLYLLYI